MRGSDTVVVSSERGASVELTAPVLSTLALDGLSAGVSFGSSKGNRVRIVERRGHCLGAPQANHAGQPHPGRGDPPVRRRQTGAPTPPEHRGRVVGRSGPAQAGVTRRHHAPSERALDLRFKEADAMQPRCMEEPHQCGSLERRVLRARAPLHCLESGRRRSTVHSVRVDPAWLLPPLLPSRRSRDPLQPLDAREALALDLPSMAVVDAGGDLLGSAQDNRASCYGHSRCLQHSADLHLRLRRDQAGEVAREASRRRKVDPLLAYLNASPQWVKYADRPRY